MSAFKIGALALATCLMTAWLVIASWFLNNWWSNHLDFVPKPPPAFGAWLVDIFGSTNAEEAGDIEFLFGYVVCFAIVATLTWLLLVAWRHARTVIFGYCVD